jgi:hypothetical protein
LKPLYKDTRGILEAEVMEEHGTKAAIHRWRKIGGGTTAEVASGHLSSFTNTSSLLSTMKGE